MREVRKLAELGSSAFAFFDDSFAVGRRRVAELSRALAETGAQWTCTAHPSHLDTSTLRAMKRAGCGGIDIGMESAGITRIKGDLDGIVKARALSKAVMRNIKQNLVFAFGYNLIGVPLAAGVLYPSFGLLLSPIVASLAMALSSVSVIGNSLRIRSVRL